MPFRFRRNQTANDDLQVRAEKLVTSARILATTAHASLAERFDLVSSTPQDRWDAVLTVAGVFVAATRANHIGLSLSVIDSLMDTVAEELDAWHPGAVAAFRDCRAFFDRAYDDLERDPLYQDQQEFVGSDAIGSWIVWNIVEHAPQSEEERNLVRALGGLVTHSFYGWWSDDAAP